MKKRIIALLCALFMLLPLAVACAETQDPVETDAKTDAPGAEQTNAPVAETTEPEPQYPAPEAKDLQGFVYRNLIVGNEMWGPIYYSEEGDQNGNIINDALYRREAFLEETFHCEVEHIVDSKALTTLGNHIGSGLDLCEAIYLSGTDTIAAAKNGYVLDIKNVEGLNLDQPWWDQRIQKEYLIGSHLFTLEGDMNMLDELRSICVVFNKSLYNDYNYNSLYGTPYDLVEQNKWTYDTLMEMIKGVTVDSTDANGRWGLVAEVSAPYYFFLGLGNKTLVNNGGEFISNIESEQVMNALQKTMQLVVNPDALIVNNGNWFVGGDVWGEARNIFKSGNVLFRSNALSSVNGYIDMANDYGILPVPNNGESNEYYCYVGGGNHRPLSFPSNLKDVETTMLLAEATAYYSRFTAKEGNVSLRDAFYYQLADYRLARSPEDTRMLDIYFDSKTFDVDQTGKITGLESAIWQLAKAGNVDGVASTITATKKTASRSLKQFLDQLAKNYD